LTRTEKRHAQRERLAARIAAQRELERVVVDGAVFVPAYEPTAPVTKTRMGASLKNIMKHPPLYRKPAAGVRWQWDGRVAQRTTATSEKLAALDAASSAINTLLGTR
jgi:hypothetical protein